MSSNALVYEFNYGDQSWRLEFHTITADEAIRLEQATGMIWVRLVSSFSQGGALGIKAFYWLARCRAGEDIKFDDPSLNFVWNKLKLDVLQDLRPESTEGENTPAGDAEDPPPATETPARSKKR
ncbi:hypothetical protein [Amycolatopsis suaedae]|uniref:Uncharacterized protein n=1 Tax=Amycolatopsis suaedae TaxID=2510978 RepID=A0A4Q7IZC7_9PSEU|nr:hypothetical protein [Amycolatopsis suaedae]RZQ59839.1 hypothetical protein EWH70_32515 [Amycolatopsis suaedae]